MLELRPRVRVVSLALVILAGTTLLFSLSFARYSTVHHRTFDLALYARVAWGLAHGDFWSPISNTHVIGVHFSPILWPLGLLGRWFGTVPTLLFAQALCVSACAWPMARIGERRLGARGMWLGVFAWMFYPNLGHVATYEFHPGTLALLPLCWALDALDRGDVRALFVFALSLLLFREDLALTGIMLGIAFTLRHRDRRGLYLSAIQAALFLGLGPLVSAFMPKGGSLDLHFGIWGGSPFGMVRALFTDPVRVWEHFRAPERLYYLPRVLGPLAFFSLRVPALLLCAVPTLTVCLVSAFPTASQQYSHYLSIAVPSLVAAALIGVTTLRSQVFHGVFVAALLAGHVYWGGLPLSRDFDATAFARDANTFAAEAVLQEISGQKSVQAPDPLLPHLAERKLVRRAPPPEAQTDYVVLDVSHRQRFAHSEDLLRTIEEPLVRTWLARKDHALLVYAPPYALFQRGRSPRKAPALSRYFTALPDGEISAFALTSCLSVLSARERDGAVELTLLAHAPCPTDLALRVGASALPARVDLLCDGALSPALLEPFDVVRSRHVLNDETMARARTRGLYLGAVRQSGARPNPTDPLSVRVTLEEPNNTTSP